MKYKLIIIPVFLWLLSGSCYAQGLFENTVNQADDEHKLQIDFSGYGRASAYGGSNFYDYSTLFAEFGIQGKLAYKRALLFTDLRFRAGSQFDSLGIKLQMKETYVGYQSDKIDVYLGAKIVSWGRMDGFNPTDNITPYDYFFLTADPDDQKLPNFLLQTRWYITPQINLELIAIPIYRPSVYRYDLFDLGEYTTFVAPALPDNTFKNGSLAARFNFDLPNTGFSVSWFRGYDPFYGFNVYDISWEEFAPSIQLQAQPYLKNTFGADFDIPLGSWVLRSEAAYNLTSAYQDSMYIPNPDISYVAGVEHSFRGVVTILQYIGKYTIDFASLDDLPPPENLNDMIIRELAAFDRKIFYQQEKTNHALSLSLSKRFAHETMNSELMGYYNITSEEWFIRPKFSWKITDNLETGIGGMFYAGPDKSVFSYASDVLNGGFVELKVSF